MTYSGNKDLTRKARELRSNMTLAEILLWSELKSKKVEGYKFRRQQPIFEYIADFYCHELKLIIEVDGEIHSLYEQAEKDKKRDRILKINGFNILHFSNYEVEGNLYGSVKKIKSFISRILSPSKEDHRGSDDGK